MDIKWFVAILILTCSMERIFSADEIDDEFLDAQSDDKNELPPNPPPLEDVPLTANEKTTEPIDFETPDPPTPNYFGDSFKDASGIGRTWILSEAKKDGVDDNIAKYNGEWEIGLPDTVLLRNDYGLIVKTKARHHAISAKLERTFKFDQDKPLIIQYDVKFQNGQECGGAYIKLLSKTGELNLKQYTDKTPYSIMFGPDKCGLTSKLHFIIRYKNPKNDSVNEHHAKQPSKGLDEYFTDHKTHLYRLEVETDGRFRLSVDQKEVTKGNLLENLEPSIIPPKEIEDPEDKKPADWDDREKIDDPEAKKPEDWDESAPEMIDDENAKKPDDWLEEEPEHVDDEKATKPNDWDEEMDGKWEPPKVKNPKCEGVTGCGKWTPPQIKNPAYKGKWRAPKISNPNYKGKWTARQIRNPSWFEESQPFKKLTPIGAVGLELWTMSDGIVFDDFLITDDKAAADAFAARTWAIKQQQESKEAAKSTVLGGLVEAANDRPWLWAVYLLIVLIPIILIAVFCFPSKKDKDAGAAKKTDAVMPDDDEGNEEEAEEEESEKSKSTEDSKKSEDSPKRRSPRKSAAKKEDLEGEDDEEEEEEGKDSKGTTDSPKGGVRQRPRRE